jgi:hypothetical protein
MTMYVLWKGDAAAVQNLISILIDMVGRYLNDPSFFSHQAQNSAETTLA